MRAVFRWRFQPLAVLALLAFLLPVSAQEGPEEWAPGAPLGWDLKTLSPEQRQRMIRISTFVNRLIPDEYLKAENGVGFTVKAIAAGGPLYARNCKRCHGATGEGDGTLATALTPAPALLGYMVQQPIAVDQYLLWSISEGGKSFDTAMPSFKQDLTQDQIWQIIAYVRAGFPDVEDGARPDSTPAARTDAPGSNAEP
jgi:mono/diheme cytochrome c family protein